MIGDGSTETTSVDKTDRPLASSLGRRTDDDSVANRRSREAQRANADARRDYIRQAERTKGWEQNPQYKRLETATNRGETPVNVEHLPDDPFAAMRMVRDMVDDYLTVHDPIDKEVEAALARYEASQAAQQNATSEVVASPPQDSVPEAPAAQAPADEGASDALSDFMKKLEERSGGSQEAVQTEAPAAQAPVEISESSEQAA